MKAYREAVQKLESLGIMPDRPPSLVPTREGLRAMGFESWGFPPERVVIVAGTNGKGSTCACLEALLLSAGKRVGFYSSPHLVETTERFRVDGRDIDPSLFVKAEARVMDACAKEGIRLTHFEALTLMAAWIFCSGEAIAPVDVLLLEVGLGGLWDSTNAIPHSTCVITPLALDHENLLGKGIVKVAEAKFGVVGAGNLVVHAPLPEDVLGLAAEVRARTASRWVERVPHEPKVVPPRTRAGGETPDPGFRVATSWGEAPLALPGVRGAENAALALTAFHALGYDPSAHLDALGSVRWAGRMQRLEPADPSLFPCPVHLSGDHNVQGVESLLELLPHFPREALHVLVSTAKDKDFQPMLRSLASVPGARLYLTCNPFRGGPLEMYGDWLKKSEGAWESPELALREIARRAAPGDRILVTGSLYLVGEILGKFGSAGTGRSRGTALPS